MGDDACRIRPDGSVGDGAQACLYGKSSSSATPTSIRTQAVWATSDCQHGHGGRGEEAGRGCARMRFTPPRWGTERYSSKGSSSSVSSSPSSSSSESSSPCYRGPRTRDWRNAHHFLVVSAAMSSSCIPRPRCFSRRPPAFPRQCRRLQDTSAAGLQDCLVVCRMIGTAS